MSYLVLAIGIFVSLLHCPFALGKTEHEKVTIDHCKWMLNCALEGLPPGAPKPPMEESFANCETEAATSSMVKDSPELQPLNSKCLKSQMAAGCSTMLDLQSTAACKELEAALKKKIDNALKGR